MSDDDLPDIEDLVTQDDLEDAIENVFTEYVDESEPEVDTSPEITDDLMDEIDSFVDRQEATEIMDQRIAQHFEHIVTEDCETEACNDIRRNLGLLPEGDDAESHEGHDHADTDEAEEADADDAEAMETDEGDATVGASDGDAGNPENDSTDGDGSEDTSTTTESDESEPSDDTEGEDVETNIFGEPV